MPSTPVKIGYARVSTQDQNLDLQLGALKKAGCRKVFHGKYLGQRAFARNFSAWSTNCAKATFLSFGNWTGLPDRLVIFSKLWKLSATPAPGSVAVGTMGRHNDACRQDDYDGVRRHRGVRERPHRERTSAGRNAAMRRGVQLRPTAEVECGSAATHRTSAGLAALLPCFAQTREPRPCATRLAVLPTSRGDLVWEAPAVERDTRERFELRECGVLQVYAFEQGKRSPTLRFDTGYDYPSYLFHSSNVLAFQSSGGSSDHVFVFQFEKGKPRLVLQMPTKDVISVKVNSADRSVTISVPPTTYPENGIWPPPPPPKTFVLRLE